jgi:hypothetical protein
VTTAGDTLRGELAVPQFPTEKGIKYYPAATAAARPFGVREVRAFGLQDGRRFRRRNVAMGRNTEKGVVDSAAVFLQQLVGGAVNLYRYDMDATSYLQSRAAVTESPQFFIDQVSGPLLPVRRLTYQALLATVLKDCPAVLSALPRTTFTEESLSRLVLHYDTLCHTATPAHTYQLPPEPSTLRLLVSLRAGAQRAKLYYPSSFYLPPGEVQPTTQALYAVELRLANRGPWSAIAGVSYTRLRGETHYLQPAQLGTTNEGQTLVLPSSVEVRQVQVPLLVRYTLGHQQWQPYVAAGLLFGTFSHNDTRLSYTKLTYVGGSNTTYYREDVQVTKVPDTAITQVTEGLALRLGLQVKISPRISPLLEAQYSSGRNREETNGIKRQLNGQIESLGLLHYQAWSFVAGLEF